MEKTEFAITWATRLVYSYAKLPASLKEYWTFLLNIEFSDQLSQERILLSESKASVYYENAIEAFVKVLQENNQLEAILILVEGLHERANKIHEVPAARGLNDLLGKLRKIAEERNLEEERYRLRKSNLIERLDSFANRIKIKVPIIIFPLVIDHILRWILLAIDNTDDASFWIGNTVIIPILVIAGSFLLNRKNTYRNLKLLDRYGGLKKYNLVKSGSSFQYSVLAFMVVFGVLINSVLIEEFNVILIFLLVLAFIAYYLLYLNLFAFGRLGEKELLDQLDKRPAIDKSLDADKNDEIIVDLQTRLQSITSRLEAYVLESALFGALAFSGFLQIMAENLVTFEDLSKFAENCMSLLVSVVHFQMEDIPNTLSAIFSTSGLFSMISVETLVCSILFLSVIAARLRFSDIADKVDRSLKLAQNFNEKEELLFEKGVVKEKARARFEMLNRKIREELGLAYEELDNMAPVTNYMRFFRNAGIGTFLVILISSSLFISGLLSLLFTLLGMSTIIYFNRKMIIEWGVNAKRNFRILFIRKGYFFLIVGLFLFALGVFLRSYFKMQSSDWWVGSGLILIGLYAFSTIAVTPFVDQKFDDQKNNNFSSQKWDVVKIVWGGGAFLFFVGFMFKFISLPGAGAILGFSTLTLGLLFIYLGNQLSKIKWLGTLIGIGVSFQLLGVLFKMLHLPGGNAALTIGLFAFPLIIVLYVVLRSRFHKTLIISTITIALISMLFVWRVYLIFEIGYGYYTTDFAKIDKMLNVRFEAESFRNQIFENPGAIKKLAVDIDKNIKEFELFRQEFDKYNEMGRIHSWVLVSYYRTSCEILKGAQDSADLEIGLKVLRTANDLGKSVNYVYDYFYEDYYNNFCPTPFTPALETDYLVALNRKQEAINVQQGYIKVVNDEAIKSELESKLAQLE